MSKPATAGPWLQAMGRSRTPSAGPWQAGEVLRLFENPLDAAVQAQYQVRCHARMKCQQHYRESKPGQRRHGGQPESPFRPRKGRTGQPGHKPGRPRHTAAKSPRHGDQEGRSPRCQRRQGNRSRAEKGHRRDQRGGRPAHSPAGSTWKIVAEGARSSTVGGSMTAPLSAGSLHEAWPCAPRRQKGERNGPQKSLSAKSCNHSSCS
jgi:hypothetical protein